MARAFITLLGSSEAFTLSSDRKKIARFDIGPGSAQAVRRLCLTFDLEVTPPVSRFLAKLDEIESERLAVQ